MSDNTQKKNSLNNEQLRARLFNIVSVGVVDEPLNQAYDVISTGALLVNLAGAFMSTFDELQAKYSGVFWWIEAITVLFFAIDFFLRLYTAPDLYPEISGMGYSTHGSSSGKAATRDNAHKYLRARLKYILSFSGIVDLLSFMPYYLPVIFPAGAAAFRLIRVIRIMRLFRINAYYDSLNVITDVIVGKRQQLLSSVFIICVMMLASSLCMYSLEHVAQPEVFKNAFSGIWWSVSTLLTVGYGDIYPITPLGKMMAIFISFLGVGLVAIPTGIISAGFVEQYSRLKRLGDYAKEEDIHFITVELTDSDLWTGKRIHELGIPHGALIAALERGGNVLPPRGDVELHAGDRLIIGAESIRNAKPMNLKEITLMHDHEWVGTAIKDLDISRHSFIVMVRRRGRLIIPRGSLVLREGDIIFLYSMRKIS